MKSQQIIYVLVLTAGLITAGSATHFALAWNEQLVVAKARKTKIEAAYILQAKAFKTANSLPLDTGKQRPPSPDVALTFVFLSLSADAIANGVLHSAVSIAGAPISSRASAVKSLFQPLPGSGNRVATVVLKVKGRYDDYAGFRRYLDAIAEFPASIRMLAVNKQSFEMEVRVYAMR